MKSTLNIKNFSLHTEHAQVCYGQCCSLYCLAAVLPGGRNTCRGKNRWLHWNTGLCTETRMPRARQMPKWFTEPSFSDLVGSVRITVVELSEDLDYIKSQPLGLDHVIFYFCSTEFPWVLKELWFYIFDMTFSASTLRREKGWGLTVLFNRYPS